METLKIQQKIYDMILYGNSCLLSYPKIEKNGLVVDIKTCMLTMLKLVITANKKYTKKSTLQDLDIQIEILKTLLRLSVDERNKYISIGQYDYWSSILSEIGKMTGGWIKSIQNN